MAACAALLHDIGHGPFSHTFEEVEKQRGRRKSHEKWSVEIIRGDTEVNSLLKSFDDSQGTALVRDVGDLVLAKDPKDIYSSLISSQFDADRMDYLRRDQYMTGTGTGQFDFEWLLDSIVVGKIYVSFGEEQDVIKQDGLILNEKGLQAAEGYLLGRYHLYNQVYMHKTTRGAEKMLIALLRRLANMIGEGKHSETGLAEDHDLVRFLHDEHKILGLYLALDDIVIWSALPMIAHGSDSVLADLAQRLHERRLYKCFDVGAFAEAGGGQALMRFRHRLQEAGTSGQLNLETDALVDRVKITAYGIHDFDERGALQKVLIRRHKDDAEPVDILRRSKILEAIGEKEIYRIYASNADVYAKISELWRGVAA